MITGRTLRTTTVVAVFGALTLLILAIGGVNYISVIPHIRRLIANNSSRVRLASPPVRPSPLPSRGAFSSNNLTNVSCIQLFKNDAKALSKAWLHENNHKYIKVPDSYYISAASDCDVFVRTRGYVMSHMTDDERDFPIAFSMLVYKDVELIERILRAIYRPQNYYCIHVDRKSDVDVYRAIVKIAGCLKNVFIPFKLEAVYWGTGSQLEAEMICVRELARRPGWRYLINLTGQEFPLKTNAELVEILKVYNGAVDIAYNTLKFVPQFKQRTKWLIRNRKRTNILRGPPPRGITLGKGSTHVVLSRDFVNYVIHNQTAKEFLEWAKETAHPDETFFNSLAASTALRIPGTYAGPEKKNNPSFTRHKIWYRCLPGEKSVRGICIVSVKTLPLLYKSQKLFVNKLNIEYHSLALTCLEELNFNRTRGKTAETYRLNTDVYKNATFVKRHY